MHNAMSDTDPLDMGGDVNQNNGIMSTSIVAAYPSDMGDVSISS